jgi:hypothetical protein
MMAVQPYTSKSPLELFLGSRNLKPVGYLQKLAGRW